MNVMEKAKSEPKEKEIIPDEVDLTEENCDPELWEKIKGKELSPDDKLPF